jgi:hypothetical protein
MIHIDAETIVWVFASEQLPDAETTVLLYSPGADDPVWFGYLDYMDFIPLWRDVSGMPMLTPVTRWADLPKGPSIKPPKPCKAEVA